MTNRGTIERLERVRTTRLNWNFMNTAVAPFNSFLEDVNLSKSKETLKSGANPVDLNELFHELRQPLSVIETLAHFIELTTTDEKILPRLDHIQRMLVKAHQILEEAGARTSRYA